MKKIIFLAMMLFSFSAFAEDTNDMMTWSEFESLCVKACGKYPFELFGERQMEAYEYYASNPQCFFVDEEELENLF